MRTLFFTLFLFPFITIAQSDFYSSANQFFKQRMVNNRLNYQLIKDEPQQLDSLVQMIQSMDTDTLSENEYLAFYINTYNLMVIKGVIDRYPVNNMQDMEGFFSDLKFNVAGEQVTLDEIEFKKIFEKRADPRFHFVLNCGAYSCPTLSNEAMLPDELEEQLNFAIQIVMDRDDYVLIDHDSRSVYVSKIFDWYRDDFTKTSTIRQFINEHRFVSIPQAYDIKYMEYDWRLNDSNAQ